MFRVHLFSGIYKNFYQRLKSAHLVMVSKNPASHSTVSKNQGTYMCRSLVPSTAPWPTVCKSLWLFLESQMQVISVPWKRISPILMSNTRFYTLLTMLSPTLNCKSMSARAHGLWDIPCLPIEGWLLSPTHQRAVFVERALSSGFMTLQPEPAYLSRLY